MQKLISILVLIITLHASTPRATSLANNKDVLQNFGEVKTLLSKMTLEEKVGQMTQITVNILESQNDLTNIPNRANVLDPKKLQNYIYEHKIGSVMHELSNGKQDLAEWNKIISDLQDYAKKTRLQIPIVFGIDNIHGAGYLRGATIFPHNIGLAATRNLELCYDCAKVTAKETRATGATWNFGPVCGIGRQPLWGRFYETFGEDVFIGSQFVGSTVRGYQDKSIDNSNSVAACIKHFIGFSNSISGWNKTPSYIPDIQLREYYFPQFRSGINAGAKTAMISFNELDGIPISASKYLIETVLRDELGFDGLILSDWEAILMLHTEHGIAVSEKDAVRIGILAGIDMCQVPWNVDFYYNLIELVNEGNVPISRIDEAVTRILKLKYEMGLFENPYPIDEVKENYKKPEYKTIAYNTAAESLTLLKNNNKILPLKKGIKIFLAGPAANNKSSLHGGWTFTWQGKNESLYPESIPTIKDVLEEYIGKENVICNSIRDYDAKENFSLKNIKNSDVVILCLGENAYSGTPGFINDLTLDKKQIELVKKVSKFGKPIITVLVEGRPRIINEIEPLMEAVLMAYIPGEKGAEAIVKSLFGENNPSGLLPFTYPAFNGRIMFYDFKGTESGVFWDSAGNEFQFGYEPQWAFGHGLSYSDFVISDLTIDKNELKRDDSLLVTVKVKNVGIVTGKKSVELYTHDHYATITPSKKRLRAFKKILLKPGEEKIVNFKIRANDIKFVGSELEWIVEEGDFDIIIADMKKVFKYVFN